MKITKLGKIAYTNSYTFKAEDTKVATRFCEHCGNYRAKTYYFTGKSKTKLGTTWCKHCIETFDTSPEDKTKFKPGDEVYYLGSLNTWQKAFVLYYEYGIYTCKVKAAPGYSDFTENFKEEDLRTKDEIP